MDNFFILLRVVAMTALVAGLAYVVSRYLRQKWHGLSRGRHLEVIDAVMVGNRQHLALVRIGSRVVCIGITGEKISPVLVLDKDEAKAILEEAQRDG